MDELPQMHSEHFWPSLIISQLHQAYMSFCNHWSTSERYCKFPQLITTYMQATDIFDTFPKLFEKIIIVWKINLLKLLKYFRSWSNQKWGVTFCPKIMGHQLSRYLNSYNLWQNFTIDCNWSNIWTTSHPLFLAQNVTLGFWGVPASQIL
jgi:hypothetical protein